MMPTCHPHHRTQPLSSLLTSSLFLFLAQVGKKILRHYPTLSVLRRHPAPSRARFDTLIAAASLRGFDIKVSEPHDHLTHRIVGAMSECTLLFTHYFGSHYSPCP